MSWAGVKVYNSTRYQPLANYKENVRVASGNLSKSAAVTQPDFEPEPQGTSPERHENGCILMQTFRPDGTPNI